jgi:DNA polymerase III sliding clamp (beta) subunit (PCNA family)
MDVPLNILHTMGAASKDAARYQLTGVFFERNGALSATATDGKQLTHVSWEDPSGAVEGFASIIPNESIKRLLKVRDGKPSRLSRHRQRHPDARRGYASAGRGQGHD